jgi:hypothetical protein
MGFHCSGYEVEAFLEKTDLPIIEQWQHHQQYLGQKTNKRLFGMIVCLLTGPYFWLFNIVLLQTNRSTN